MTVPNPPEPHASAVSWRSAWQRHRLLIWALAMSVVLHAGLLLLRVVPPEQWRRVLPPQALELILVNASTEQAPLVPTTLAQANLDGGGLANVGEATTPLEASPHRRAGDDVQESEARIQRLRQEQQLLLSQVKTQLARLDVGEAGTDQQDGNAAAEQQARRKALADVLARIERRIQEENARPRKRYISAAAKRAVYAAYYDQVREQIEADGTAHFPSVGAQRLYGDLTLSFTVNHDGRVLDVEVLVGSGQAELDEATRALVRAQRFKPFDALLRRELDQLGVVSSFHFTRDQQVRSELFAR